MTERRSAPSWAAFLERGRDVGPRAKPAVESRVMFTLFTEGSDLVLRDGAGKEKSRLTVSTTTLRLFSIEDVASDLETSLAYEMRDEQGREDLRR